MSKKAAYSRNSNMHNRQGMTYRFQARASEDELIDEIFPSCSAIVKKYGERFDFNRDIIFRLRKKHYKTDFNSHGNDKYSHLKVTDIAKGDTVEGCENLIERHQNMTKIQALLEKSEHLNDILVLLQGLERN